MPDEMTPAESLAGEYVLELLSEHGKRRAELGRGDDLKQALRAYEKACRKYPHTHVRLRQGKQTIALSVPELFPMAAGHA